MARGEGILSLGIYRCAVSHQPIGPRKRIPSTNQHPVTSTCEKSNRAKTICRMLSVIYAAEYFDRIPLECSSSTDSPCGPRLASTRRSERWLACIGSIPLDLLIFDLSFLHSWRGRRGVNQYYQKTNCRIPRIWKAWSLDESLLQQLVCAL